MFDRLLDEIRNEKIKRPEDCHIHEAINTHDRMSGEHGVIQFGGGRFDIAGSEVVEQRLHTVQRINIVLLRTHQHALET